MSVGAEISLPESSVQRIASRRRLADPWRAAAAGLILLGVALRLWQLLANPSIWVDLADRFTRWTRFAAIHGHG